MFEPLARAVVAAPGRDNALVHGRLALRGTMRARPKSVQNRVPGKLTYSPDLEFGTPFDLSCHVIGLQRNHRGGHSVGEARCILRLALVRTVAQR